MLNGARCGSMRSLGSMGVSVPFFRLEIRRGKLRAAKLGQAIDAPVEAVRERLEAGMR